MAELPGIRQKDIEIEIHDGSITIKGERKPHPEVEKEKYLSMERSYGSLQKSFVMPQAVEQAKIKAVYKNGILQVNLPKAERAKMTRVSISSG